MLRRSLCAGALALVVFPAQDADAIGAVLTSLGERVPVVAARYAVATSATQTTRWASLDVGPFPGAMAWILPVRSTARVDEVTDAWFEALENATAPRVVPPLCNGRPALRGGQIEGSTNHRPTSLSSTAAILDDVNALRSFVESFALDLPPNVQTRLESYESAGFRLLALVYAGGGSDGLTRTVRVTDNALPTVPLLATLANGAPIPVSAFIIGASRAKLGSGPELKLAPRSITLLDDTGSTYKDVVGRGLLATGGTSWLIESSGEDLVSRGVPSPTTLEATPALIDVYLGRTITYGDAASAHDACASTVANALQNARPVGRACARGQLARGLDDDCSEVTPPDATPAAEFRCGEGAEDLALAFSGLPAQGVWITRLAGIVPPDAFGDDVDVAFRAGPGQSPFVVASDLTCAAPPGNPWGPPPAVGGTAPPWGAPSAPTTIDVSPPVVTTNAAISCSCAPASEGSSTTQDSCDHSDDSSNADDSCSGDSSDSSDDGCSNDSGGNDSGCGESSGSGSGASKCSVSRRTRRGRSHTSLVTLALSALLLPLRRLTRPRRRRQDPTSYARD